MPVATDAAVGTAVSGMQPVLVGVQDTSAVLQTVRGTSTGSDGLNAAGATAVVAGAIGLGFNGATWDRLRSASAAILAAFSSFGAALVSLPGDWSVFHSPAAATQATISKAAAGAGVRHICTSISATFATNGTAGQVQLALRDGATGAGTILWSKSVILPATGVWEVSLTGLNIVGSANTALTLEFTAAGPAASLQSVALTGHEAA